MLVTATIADGHKQRDRESSVSYLIHLFWFRVC